MKLLKEYIKIILEVGEEKTSQKAKLASDAGMGIFKRQANLGGKNGIVVALYKTNVFVGNILASLDDDKKSYDVDMMQSGIDKSVVGIVALHAAAEPSYGAWELSNAASKGGFGPMLHDVAMAYAPRGLIIPDRNAVSKEESDLYSFYQKRSDIRKLKLDDIDDPKTPATFDDSKIWHDGRDHLNFAYGKPNKLNVKELERNHEAAMQHIMKYMQNLGWDKDIIDDILQTAAADFFNAIYAEVPEASR